MQCVYVDTCESFVFHSHTSVIIIEMMKEEVIKISGELNERRRKLN